jgi:hypothetical protein
MELGLSSDGFSNEDSSRLSSGGGWCRTCGLISYWKPSCSITVSSCGLREVCFDCPSKALPFRHYLMKISALNNGIESPMNMWNWTNSLNDGVDIHTPAGKGSK